MTEIRTASRDKIPFLPGNSIRDTARSDFRLCQTLDYKNGYPIRRVELPPDLQSPEQLLNAAGADPWITYAEQTGHGRLSRSESRGASAAEEERFVPAHVAFDKVVLRFDAYFKQTVHESIEQYHLRRVRILYYVEDDSIAVVEPPVENSGIPQGVLIKRQRMPKDTTSFYTIRDFNRGLNVTFYGKTFRIVGCDKFTESYMQETEHIALNPPEPMPVDPHEVIRSRPTRIYTAGSKGPDKLKRFLENDRKVLRFYCIWDDRDSMFGELREFVLHYYLVDDSVEVREVQKPNNGRDPFPILLRRQQLPKAFKDLSDVSDTAKYTWKDFRVGNVINVLGRPFLIRDCDDYTRKFYAEHLNLAPNDMKPLDLKLDKTDKDVEEIPPYNGFGSVEDSLGSVKYLVLKPPKKDFIKMLENEHKVLRFVAKMGSKHKEDRDRRFVITYRLADDMMTIYEPPQRNAGVIGGKFMERTRVLLPGSSLSDPRGPRYYTAKDLYVGATVTVFAHRFILLDADEYVFNYMEKDPASFPQSDCGRILTRARSLIKQCGGDAAKKQVEDVCAREDATGSGRCARQTLVAAGREIWGIDLSDHEIITLARQFEDSQRQVDYKRLVAAL